jgi:hypothetical protein
MAKVFLVWNKNRTECVGFTDKDDARQAAGAKRMSNPCATLAEAWRETYADDEPKLKFEIQEVEVG